MKKFLIAAIISMYIPIGASAHTLEQDGKGLIEKPGFEYKLNNSFSLFTDYKLNMTADSRNILTPRLVKAGIKYNF